MTAPVTPSSGEAAADFIKCEFGEELARKVDPGDRATAVRHRRITEMRRCGELRSAERYGWLSLAALLLGMNSVAVERIDPSSPGIMHRAGGRDILPDPLGEDEAPKLVPLLNTDIEVSDPRDPLGFGVIRLAASALTEVAVEVDGRRLGGAAVAASLRERLEKTNVD